jgi:hypothetical protein
LSASWANVFCDGTFVVNLCIVPHAAEEPIDYSRSSARATCDFPCAFFVYLYAQNLSRTFANDFQVFVRIEIKMKDNPEATSQWSGD